MLRNAYVDINSTDQRCIPLVLRYRVYLIRHKDLESATYTGGKTGPSLFKFDFFKCKVVLRLCKTRYDEVSSSIKGISENEYRNIDLQPRTEKFSVIKRTFPYFWLFEASGSSLFACSRGET